ASPVVSACAFDGIHPGLAATREQRIERRSREHVVERRQVDDLAVLEPADAWRLAGAREDAEAGHARNATLAPGRAPRSGSMRTASGPGGSSAKHSLSGARVVRPFPSPACPRRR